MDTLLKSLFAITPLIMKKTSCSQMDKTGKTGILIIMKKSAGTTICAMKGINCT